MFIFKIYICLKKPTLKKVFLNFKNCHKINLLKDNNFDNKIHQIFSLNNNLNIDLYQNVILFQLRVISLLKYLLFTRGIFTEYVLYLN